MCCFCHAAPVVQCRLGCSFQTTQQQCLLVPGWWRVWHHVWWLPVPCVPCGVMAPAVLLHSHSRQLPASYTPGWAWLMLPAAVQQIPIRAAALCVLMQRYGPAVPGHTLHAAGSFTVESQGCARGVPALAAVWCCLMQRKVVTGFAHGHALQQAVLTGMHATAHCRVTV